MLILIDNALVERQRSGQPVRVALVGAGYSGHNTTDQILNSFPGMRLVAIAECNLNAGEALDGLGEFTRYAPIEDYAISQSENTLPMRVADGCTVKNNIEKDQTMTYDDVRRPPNRLYDRSCDKQRIYFGRKAATA